MDKKEKTSLQCTAKASPIADSAVLKTNKCCGFFFLRKHLFQQFFIMCPNYKTPGNTEDKKCSKIGTKKVLSWLYLQVPFASIIYFSSQLSSTKSIFLPLFSGVHHFLELLQIFLKAKSPTKNHWGNFV